MSLVIYFLTTNPKGEQTAIPDTIPETSKLSVEKVRGKLDSLVQTLKDEGIPLIEEYIVLDNSAYIRLNPRMWNSLTSGEQRQVCDILAVNKIWEDNELLNAWLFVYETRIGRIAPDWNGGFKFKPEAN